jgi:hypothetical protein
MDEKDFGWDETAHVYSHPPHRTDINASNAVSHATQYSKDFTTSFLGCVVPRHVLVLTASVRVCKQTNVFKVMVISCIARCT